MILKKTDSMLFKIALIFIAFSLVTLIIGGVFTYISQMDIYKSQCLANSRMVGRYLASLMEADGEEMIQYQEYFLKRGSELRVKYGFDNYRDAKREFERLFSLEYPGKALIADVPLSELSDELLCAYLAYKHEYWLLTFEQAAKDYELAYSYYMTLDSSNHNVTYFVDCERIAQDINGEVLDEFDPASDDLYIYFNYSGFSDPAERVIQWKTWDSGEEQDEYQIWDNEYGHTYAYYVPLIVKGVKLGVVGVEVDVDTVNRGILNNTLNQLAGVGASFVVSLTLLLLIIYNGYIKRITKLESEIKEYSLRKDPAIAADIEKISVGRDEISSLSERFVSMILELEEYMKNLVTTVDELTDVKKKAAELSALADRDALTGIRNRAAYDKEAEKLSLRMKNEGFTEFGVAMVDLNFLKPINDTYGHDKGNLAIKALCMLVCVTFKHSPVFRIGGDEFAAIIMNDDYVHAQKLIEKFDSELDQLAADPALEPWEKISAAIGTAFFDPANDTDFDSVFKRADKAMYKRKKDMKALRQ